MASREYYKELRRNSPLKAKQRALHDSLIESVVEVFEISKENWLNKPIRNLKEREACTVFCYFLFHIKEMYWIDNGRLINITREYLDNTDISMLMVFNKVELWNSNQEKYRKKLARLDDVLCLYRDKNKDIYG